ncbi:sigma-54-dependent transcriptional regulator [Myroides injenensis]|uniref:sigma-54-dependent transcriptional regulator n=1 Tax=Myroides injenensis TaxID=1183151 RepID=UPI000474E322|nr:sigma-54 dependent transcriptional regulator [Myroides injenensis]
MSRILIVEDESAIRRVLKKILEEESSEYVVDTAEDGEDGLQKITNEDYDLVISDIKMPKLNGEELLIEAKKIKPQTVFVMISGHGDLETAVNTMRLGAYDYISKPPDLNRLLTTVRNALDTSKLVVENTILKKKINKKYDMIGNSKPINHIKAMIEKVAPTDARVLITGPNGTGKELVAHQIHLQSNRASNPLIEVNCAAIPSELIESELFGHVKGAFTSAVKDRPGKFELANKGTIFLDEIGDMSLPAQAKVLRALQENIITRVGADKDVKVDVRVIAATNKDLRKEIEEGRFREDLYHRLAVILIEVPGLNDRRDDIPLLLNHFVKQIADEQGTAVKEFSEDAIQLLQEYNWTGNIRELRNVIERLIILGGKTVTKQDVELFANK